MALTAASPPRLGRSVALTYAGAAEIPTHWLLVGVDPLTGEETAPAGTLKWPLCITDRDGRAVNFYQAPAAPESAGLTDRVKVKVLPSA